MYHLILSELWDITRLDSDRIGRRDILENVMFVAEG